MPSLCIGRGTIREWLLHYRHGGLDGLTPSSRRDTGKSRALDDRVGAFVEDLARSRPALDGSAIRAEIGSKTEPG